MKKTLALFSLLCPLYAAADSMPRTLFELGGAHPAPARLSDSVLVIVDAQREYVDGALPLVGVEAAIAETARLLKRARAAGTPVAHIVHRGVGDLFNPAGPYFAIVSSLTPTAGESVIEKGLPNAFAGTGLAEFVARTGRRKLILTGFATHMCISSTARAALDLGYATTIVAAATATRDLPDGKGGVVSAAEVQRAGLAALADRFAVIAGHTDDIPE